MGNFSLYLLTTSGLVSLLQNSMLSLIIPKDCRALKEVWSQMERESILPQPWNLLGPHPPEGNLGSGWETAELSENGVQDTAWCQLSSFLYWLALRYNSHVTDPSLQCVNQWLFIFRIVRPSPLNLEHTQNPQRKLVSLHSSSKVHITLLLQVTKCLGPLGLCILHKRITAYVVCGSCFHSAPHPVSCPCCSFSFLSTAPWYRDSTFIYLFIDWYTLGS